MCEFMIQQEGKTVGKAMVEREGMFYILRCTVEFDGLDLPEIILQSKAGEVMCGRCVPNGTEAVLLKRISVKQWDLNTGKIYASYRTSEDKEMVEEGRPFMHINRLPLAKYCSDKKQIVFK